MAVGWNSDWNRSLLKIIKGYVDYITLHIYLPEINIIKNILGWTPLPKTEKVYYAMLNSPFLVEEKLSECEEDIISVYGQDGLDKLKIAFDEWNIWYHFRQALRADKPHYNLRDGLWSACVINAFIRHAKSVYMANFAQMVNAIAMILTYDDKIVMNPHYLAFKMYGDALINDSFVVSTQLECPDLISEKYTNIPDLMRPLLDISALISNDNKKLTLFCVNKHLEKAVDTEIEFNDAILFKTKSNIKGTVLTHEDPHAKNTRKNPNNIQLQNFEISYNGESLSHKFPPHSATALQFLS
jgi:alpha-N-arabinofuranosidase